MNDKPSKISSLLGKGLAHAQDGVDRVFTWGFSKMKRISRDPDQEHNRALRYAKKFGSFLGEAGEEFYSEYERLKISRQNKNDAKR